MSEQKELSAQEHAINGIKKMSPKHLHTKSSMMEKELEKLGRKIEPVSDDKIPTAEQLKRLDAEIASKKVIHKGPVF